MANNSFFGFLAGAAIGAIATAYLLSDKGKDDAERLKQAAGDLAEKAKNKAGQRFKDILEANAGRMVPAWLEADAENLTGTVKEYPTRDQIDVPVNEVLIVELYSK